MNFGNPNDGTANLLMPFPFTFYGVSYSAIYLSTNGNAQFAVPNASAANGCLPSVGQPNAAIYALWDDLTLTNPSVYVRTFGSIPNRRWVIEWVNVQHFGGSGAVTFEIVLHETTNDIVLQYQDVDFANAAFDNGASATVGVEDWPGTAATQHSCNTASLSANQAIRFWWCQFLTPSATPAVSATRTATRSACATHTPSVTRTASATASATRTATPSASASTTQTQTATPTSTPTIICFNWSFELGSLANWTASGAVPVVLMPQPPAPVMAWDTRGDSFCARLGTPPTPSAGPAGDSTLTRDVTIPSGLSSAALSFWYWPATDDQVTETPTTDWVECQVRDTSGGLLAQVMRRSSNQQTWLQRTFDLTPYIGQTVRLTFNVHQDAAGDESMMYLNDVTLDFACVSPSATLTASPTESETATVTRTAVSSRTPTESATETSSGTPTPSETATATQTTTPTPDLVPPSCVTDVMAVKAGANDIQLSWTAATDNVGVAGYWVWRGTSRFFAPVGCGTPGASVTPYAFVAAASPTVTWVDAAAQLATTADYYYVVKAADAAGNCSPCYSNFAFKLNRPVTASKTSPCNPSMINWLSLPYVSEWADMQGMGQGLSGCTKVGYWHETAQLYVNLTLLSGTWVPPSNNLPLSAGRGYLAVNTTAANWILVGAHPWTTPALSWVYDPTRSNLQWVSFPYHARYASADDLVNGGGPTGNPIPNVTQISRWNEQTQCYEDYIRFPGPFWAGTNFAFTPGEAYLISIETSTSWTPSVYVP